MAREAGLGKKTTYLSINAAGEMVSTSKEPREGYEETTNKNGDVYYKKVFAGTDFGHISGLGIIEKEFERGKVKYLHITIENEDARDVLQLPLERQSGDLTDIVRKAIAVLPNVDFSKELTIASNRKRNERGYVDQALFFNYVEDGQISKDGLKFALRFGTEGDVPMPDKKKSRDGSIKYDFTEQDDYLYNKLLEELERFKEFKNSNHESAEVAPKVTEGTSKKAKAEPKEGKKKSKDIPVEPELVSEEEEEDDNSELPF